MARNSLGIYLMEKKADKYEKLVDILNLPNLDPAKDLLDASTLSDYIQVQIEGRAPLSDGFAFNLNYDVAMYKKLRDPYVGQTKNSAVYIGDDGNGKPTGTEGIWEFPADATVSMGEVGDRAVEVLTMTLTLLPKALPTFKVGA